MGEVLNCHLESNSYLCDQASSNLDKLAHAHSCRVVGPQPHSGNQTQDNNLVGVLIDVESVLCSTLQRSCSTRRSAEIEEESYYEVHGSSMSGGCPVAILAAFSFSGQLRAQTTNEKLYVITHVDLMPTAATDGTKLLKDFAAESRRDPGVVRFELMVENGHLNHFTIVQIWENMKAFEGHEEAEHTRRFREKIQPMLGSPFDERYRTPCRTESPNLFS